jgi:surface protein
MPTSTGKIYLGSTLVASGETAAAWQRPADWLAVPDMSSTEGVAGLFAVWPNDSNFVAFTVAGAYDVDWGDGTSASFASGATAEHVYTYSGISSSTDSTRGYRQVIIEITPQSGASLTSIVLNVKHSTAGLVSGAASGWLDVEVNAPSATSTLLFQGTNVVHRLLEQATIHAWGGTNLSSMFQNCRSLQSVPLFDTSSVTVFASMFNGCTALQSVPFFDTSNGTNFGSMFQSCVSLQSVPLFDTSSGTFFNNMFLSCSSLKSVPLFDTSSGTDFSSMFSSCRSLQSVPFFDTSSGTNFGSMLSTCTSLKSVPLFDTSNATNVASMLGGCTALQSVPFFDTSGGTNFFNMFLGCGSLQSVALLDTSSITNFQNAFSGCSGLAAIPALDMSAATNVTNTFLTATSLAKCEVTGLAINVSFANCSLSSAALDEIYTNLADLTGLTGQTITVTGNYGTAGDDTTIATNKNWTVTG